MKYWVFVFSPETYKVVKDKKMCGVRDGVRKRFFEQISKGDKFVGYISGDRAFDCLGTIDSDAFGAETSSWAFRPSRPNKRRRRPGRMGL